MQKKGKKKQQMQSTQKPFDFVLCIIILLLLSLGIVMVLSASAPSSLSIEGNSYTYVTKQFIFAVVGVALMFFISKIDYHKYQKYYVIAYIVALVALISVAIPGIGRSVNGAKRWVNLGFGPFQPSEIAKVALILFYAGFLTEYKKNLPYFWKGCMVCFVLLIFPIGILFFVQDHLSASVVIVAIVSIMMIMAGTKLRHFLSIGITGGSAAAALMLLLATSMNKGNFRLDRITTFLDPWQDPTGKGWQVIQGLYAIGSGGLFGVGLGQSRQKYLYIPEPHNDFIFAIIAEELGFVGCTIIIALFALFIWRGILIAMKAPDSFGSLLAIGITSLVGIQAIINIAVVTSSMPATGMSLPFFSYGGTALLILLCSMGVLLNISRASSKV